eukprot:TRINITY_DN3732_c0_g1_i1.p1 TRINITY_DN3732_c0_g1~~TRINITY_DN3732_c0_g1_i1.p1  ORF type:complete len:438 (+),score=-58.91 TRINITY_DN3732_c0_g1_i1:50-1363(+)
MDDKKATWGEGGLFGNRALGSLLLILYTQPFCMLFIYTCQELNGSIGLLAKSMYEEGILNFLFRIWPTPFDELSIKIVLSFMAFELLLMKIVPGKEFRGVPTATGHVPIYTDNGVACYIISIISLFVLAQYVDIGIVYDKMPTLLSTSNMFGLILVVILYIKGLYFPSTKDNSSSGNIIVDLFWGTELYPRILGWDVKTFTNCRYGLMFWQLGIFCFAAKQYSLYGYVSSSMFVSIALQTIYLTKFYIWETGYFNSMDIQHDRAGYYICWGCMVAVPSMYTVHTLYMVEHPLLLSLPHTLLSLFGGIACIYINYDCDRQRQAFRRAEGKDKIWGKDPTYIIAKYTPEDGRERTSLLLTSGYWAISRHFHYIPEVLAACFWCFPGFFEDALPYYYPIYLSILLIDRAYRDDARCRAKYGKYWDEYCKKVPAKVIPGVV